MILVCEPICRGFDHVIFNAALLETICMAYPSKPVHFYGEESHLQQVRAHIGDQRSFNILWQPIELPPSYATLFSRLSMEFKLISHLLSVAEANTNNNIVLTNIRISILMAIKFFLKFVNRKALIQIIIHHRLNSLNRIRSYNPFMRFTPFKIALTMGSNKKIQYIFLEESIRIRFQSILPSFKGNVAVLEHPVVPEQQGDHIMPFAQPFRFGFLGRTIREKGFDSYLQLASEIKDKLPGRAEFHVIGFVPDGQSKFEMNSLDVPPLQTPLDRKQYVYGLKRLHFVCLPYKDHYQLSPSGVLLDAVAFKKPLIASRLPIFEDLFHQYGDIGYLFDDEAELCDIIKKIMQEANAQRYMDQVINLKKLRLERHPRFLSDKYRNICSHFSRESREVRPDPSNSSFQ